MIVKLRMDSGFVVKFRSHVDQILIQCPDDCYRTSGAADSLNEFNRSCRERRLYIMPGIPPIPGIPPMPGIPPPMPPMPPIPPMSWW